VIFAEIGVFARPLAELIAPSSVSPGRDYETPGVHRIDRWCGCRAATRRARSVREDVPDWLPRRDIGRPSTIPVVMAIVGDRSAALVDKVLKGTRPADLPIERAVKFDLIVNLRRAKTLGIELPTSLLLRANEVNE
jgi:hypothetical protein